MLPWTIGLGIFGYTIGIFVGADAMQDVDASTLGGGVVQTMLEIKVFNWVSGVCAGIGIVVGFIIDMVRDAADEASFRHRLRSAIYRPAASKREQAEAADSMVARGKRFAHWRAEGKTSKEINDLEAAISREQDEADNRRRQARFAAAAEEAEKKPLRWVD